MQKSLDCSRGALVEANGRRFRITNDALGFEEVQALDLSTGRYEIVKISDLCVPGASDLAEAEDKTPDLSAIEEPLFAEALRRKELIDHYLQLPKRTREHAKHSAAELGMSVASFYRLLSIYQADDRTSSLIPRKRDGGRGKSRLPATIETLVERAIKEHHLTPRQRRVRATYRYLERLCRNEGVKAPHENTVAARIKSIDQETYLRERGHIKEARERFTPYPRHYEEALQPLDVVQIDHTQLDIFVVDEDNRLPLKCPWITIVFDVYSRMVLGFYISFDSPGAYGTGLALYRAIVGKEKWLAELGVDEEWPCWGFPTKIHADNAREFRGDMLKRACEQYGMSIGFRSLKRPEYGSHIERWLGTLMQEIHELPGPRHKPHKRGDFNPEEDSAYTLRELEYHIATYITGVYHQKMHSGINSSPLQRWTDAILGDGKKLGMGLPPRATQEDRLRLDLMPFEERTIQNYGVQIDEVRYYNDVLRRYIGRKPAKLYTFRYDPRDVSSIYFWDPDLSKYFEIHYANIRRPSVSIWELRAVRRHLRAEGRKRVNEDLIFATYDKLRTHQEAAEAETKRVRQIVERRKSLARDPKPVAAKNASSAQDSRAQSRPALKLVSTPPVAPRFNNIEALEVDTL